MYGSTFLSPLFSFYFYLFIYLFYNFSSFWISWLEFKCLYLGNTLSILLQYSTGSISVFHLCSTKGIPTQFSIGTSWWGTQRLPSAYSTAFTPSGIPLRSHLGFCLDFAPCLTEGKLRPYSFCFNQPEKLMKNRVGIPPLPLRGKLRVNRCKILSIFHQWSVVEKAKENGSHNPSIVSQYFATEYQARDLTANENIAGRNRSGPPLCDLGLILPMVFPRVLTPHGRRHVIRFFVRAGACGPKAV